MDASLLPRVDVKLLVQNMGGNDKIIPQLFEMFWETCDSCVKRMEKALSKKDIKAWHTTAHTLKGAALNVTARRIAGLCEEAESVSKLKYKEASAILYHLHKEIAILRKEIGA